MKNTATQDISGPHGSEVIISVYAMENELADLRHVPGWATDEPVPISHLPIKMEAALRGAIASALANRLPEHMWPEVNECVILRDPTNRPEGATVTLKIE